jgi:tungstate transport system permease protein
MQISEFVSIASLTLYVSGTALIVSSVLGLPLGVWLGLSKHPLLPLIRAALHTAMALPPVVVGLVLYILLSRSGPLGFLGWLLTPRAMILAQIILAFPFVVGITMSAVAAVPRELLMQLLSLGASQYQARWTVLREARHGALLAVAAAFGRSISEVGAVMIVGGNIPGHTQVLTTAIVEETSQGAFGFALAMGGLLLAMALVVNILMLRLHTGRLLA